MDTASSRFKRKMMIDVELDNFHAQKRFLSEKMAQELGFLSLSPSSPRNNGNRSIESLNPFLRTNSRQPNNIKNDNSKNNNNNNNNRTTKKYNRNNNHKNNNDDMVFNFNYTMDDDDKSSVQYCPIFLPKTKDHKKRDKNNYANRMAGGVISNELMYSLPPKSILRAMIPVDIPHPFTDYSLSKAIILYKSPSEVILRSLEKNKSTQKEENSEEMNQMIVEGEPRWMNYTGDRIREIREDDEDMMDAPNDFMQAS